MVLKMGWTNIRAKEDFFEIRRFNESNPNQSIRLKPKGHKLKHFHAKINGPPGTAYETGKFVVCIHVPKKYPKIPPRVFFKTRIWHPNVLSKTGAIYLNILADQWSSKLSLHTTLVSIQALLSAPEADCAVEPEVGRQCKYHPDLFNFTVQVWTNLYAKGKHQVGEYEDKVEYMLNMGISENKAVYILSTCDWDIPESVKKAFQMLKNFEFSEN